MHLDIRPDAENPRWTDLKVSASGVLTRIGLVRGATSEGRVLVAMAIQLRDGRIVHAETTWRLLRNAVRALAAGPIAAEEHDEGEQFRTTMHAAMASAPPRRGRPAVSDDHVLDDVGDLSLALGGDRGSWTAQALRLIGKSDLKHRGWLAAAMPDLVAAYTIWETIQPTVTAGQLLVLLEAAADIANESERRS